MIEFSRCYHFPLIQSVMRDPALYDRAADDYAPPREAFEPRHDPDIWYILVTDAQGLLGFFILAPQNTVCWEIHTRLLPQAWGPRATVASAAIIEWVWANTPARRLVSFAPAYNRLAIRFAERAGMTRYGVNPASWMKNGKLHDQILLGVSAVTAPRQD